MTSRYEGNLIVERFGWWVRLYSGHTVNRRRLWRWNTGLSRGVTLRIGSDTGGFDGALRLGIQWRRAVPNPESEPA